jgi:hypothetical protein
MGRGRAKAKQVKVARQLKYSGGDMNLDRLRAEIGAGNEPGDGDHSGWSDRYPGADGEDEDEFADDLDEDDEDPAYR